VVADYCWNFIREDNLKMEEAKAKEEEVCVSNEYFCK
jgi:hypothetical protein